jgi:uncharacterized protein (TIGR02266 family)
MARSTVDDTRRFRRQGLRVLVDYQCDGGVHCDYATSISEGGLFIETETTLSLGSNVKIRFRLPKSDTLHDLEGRVCWCNDNTGDGPNQAPGFGIAFASSEDSALLVRELEDLQF